MVTKRDNIKKLYQISRLKDGWNGYGAKGYNKKEVMKLCKPIIKKLNIQPSIFPTGRNSVQFEYNLDNGYYLEFEVYMDESDISYMMVDPNYSIIESGIIDPKETNMINEIVNEFHMKYI